MEMDVFLLAGNCTWALDWHKCKMCGEVMLMADELPGMPSGSCTINFSAVFQHVSRFKLRRAPTMKTPSNSTSSSNSLPGYFSWDTLTENNTPGLHSPFFFPSQWRCKEEIESHAYSKGLLNNLTQTFGSCGVLELIFDKRVFVCNSISTQGQRAIESIISLHENGVTIIISFRLRSF
ncbi:unnamed protein product [Lactuca virosa]|uniref:Uncharacterized protein n=1 Tax=Lactuca virosa TaxID=75947 RepID=A0AAU9P9J3_9ASTR|nr:unnamed protein product [Lactuca virosa]